MYEKTRKTFIFITRKVQQMQSNTKTTIITILLSSVVTGCASMNNQTPQNKNGLYGESTKTSFDSVYAYYLKNKTSDQDVLFYILSNNELNKKYTSMKEVNIPTNSVFTKAKAEMTAKSQFAKPNFGILYGLYFEKYTEGKGLALPSDPIEMNLSNPNVDCARTWAGEGRIGTCKYNIEHGGASKIQVKLQFANWYLPADALTATDIQMKITNSRDKNLSALVNYTITQCKKNERTADIYCDTNIDSIAFYGTKKVSPRSKPIGYATHSN